MHTVILYDCNLVGQNCSSTCLESREDFGFQCGWCVGDVAPTRCSIEAECTDSVTQPRLLASDDLCLDRAIDAFSPTSGPPNGGTLITITGRDLGMTIDDFDPPNSITVGGVMCTPLSMGYVSGRTVLCRTGANLPVGLQELVVRRRSGRVFETATEGFLVVMPTVSSVEPEFGPIAGGSVLRISGTGLDISSPGSVRVTLGGAAGPECVVR